MSELDNRTRAVWRRLRGPINGAVRFAGVLKKTIFRRPLPTPADGKLRVHLGCGPIELPDYVNVDMMPLPHVHYVGGVQRLPMFLDASVDLLYACHVLEHVPRRELVATLAEWRRVLKPGAMVRISVPDFDLLVQMMREEGDVAAIQDPLFGSFEHPYDLHHSAFTRPYLGRLLEEVNFRHVRTWDPKAEGLEQYGDWSSRKARGRKTEHFVSLNVEATR